jgi:uncharacterized membrane protein YraQ (UPF0718 family)
MDLHPLFGETGWAPPSFLFVGALMRMVEAAAFAAPTVLCGLLLVGVFRCFLGHSGTRRLFGDDRWRSLPQSWLFGMLIPVCSIGVIPALREMKKAGIGGGVIIAFALSAPLFNPVSILYGLTLSHPSVVLAFAFCSLVLVTVLGLAWGKFFAPKTQETPEAPMPAVGWKRVASLLLVCCREITGRSGLYMLLALIGVGLLSAALPFGRLQYTMYHTDWKSPVIMLAVAPWLFVTPTAVMGQLGSMFDHGNSIGAGLVLLTVGAAVNLGVMAWLWRSYGGKAFAAWAGCFAVTVLALAYAVEEPLYYAGKTGPSDHTHAFDMYCSPFNAFNDSPLAAARTKLALEVSPHEWQSLWIVLGLAAAGFLLRVLDRFVVLEDWLARSPATAPELGERPRFDVVVPTPALGAISLVGLVMFGVLACYIYYPPPKDAFQTISMVQANAVVDARNLQEEEAERWILFYSDLVRKAEAGASIRGWQVSDESKRLGSDLRQKLDDLRHAVERGELEPVQECVKACLAAHRQWRETYRRTPVNAFGRFFGWDEGLE